MKGNLKRERALNCHVPFDEGLRLSSLALKQHDAHKNNNLSGVLQRKFEATKMQETKCRVATHQKLKNSLTFGQFSLTAN